jgi:hypothetical protein
MTEVIMRYSGKGEDLHDLTRVGELVRCENCTWFLNNDCINPLGITLPDVDDYCSYGQRKEDDE